MTLAVTTVNLSKRYGNQSALDHVDLQVPEGSVYVLVGANGAGKSTTFKILSNLERPDSGSASVFGLDTGVDGPRARAQIGYVPENHDSLYRWMTCGRVLEYVAAFYPSWDPAYADRLVKAFNVQLDRKTGNLSKGEARRLQLITALAHRPPLLLLDEPTEALDPVARRQLLSLVSEHLSDCPTTMIIATHHVHEVENLADHVGALNAGHLVAQMSLGDLHEKARQYQLELSDDWKAPSGFYAQPIRVTGSDAQWTIIGDENDVVQRLKQAGAVVRGSRALTFEDATLALLSGDRTS